MDEILESAGKSTKLDESLVTTPAKPEIITKKRLFSEIE